LIFLLINETHIEWVIFRCIQSSIVYTCDLNLKIWTSQFSDSTGEFTFDFRPYSSLCRFAYWTFRLLTFCLLRRFAYVILPTTKAKQWQQRWLYCLPNQTQPTPKPSPAGLPNPSLYDECAHACRRWNGSRQIDVVGRTS